MFENVLNTLMENYIVFLLGQSRLGASLFVPTTFPINHSFLGNKQSILLLIMYRKNGTES